MTIKPFWRRKPMLSNILDLSISKYIVMHLWENVFRDSTIRYTWFNVLWWNSIDFTDLTSYQNRKLLQTPRGNATSAIDGNEAQTESPNSVEIGRQEIWYLMLWVEGNPQTIKYTQQHPASDIKRPTSFPIQEKQHLQFLTTHLDN